MRTLHGYRNSARAPRPSRARRALWALVALASLAGIALLVSRGVASSHGSEAVALEATFTFGGASVTASRINAFLESRLGFTSRGGEMKCSYVSLGQEPAVDARAGGGGAVRMFVDALCLELVREGDSLAVGSGKGVPAAVSGRLAGDSVQLVDVTVPGDGSLSAADIRRIFPHAVAQRLLQPTPSALGPRRAMERALRDRAATRLGIPTDAVRARRR